MAFSRFELVVGVCVMNSSQRSSKNLRLEGRRGGELWLGLGESIREVR